ncbi:MAG TPA: glycosyl hydrolase [Gaiellales bacterium]|nr:glycosyl hydrolase [Gaiellales bacterium]
MRSQARRSRAAGACSVCLCALILISVQVVGAASARGHNVSLGVYVGSNDRLSHLRRYSRMVGRQPVIISTYRPWRLPPFPRSALAPIWRSGAVPLVTWEPWTYRGKPFALRRIAAGSYDTYVRAAARAAAAWGHPIMLRFAQEMNGNWYPWGRGHVSAGVYKAAWRHLVRVFRVAGASNVSWVWTPIVNNGGRYPFAGFYPGDRWVDWVGLDGYNWGNRESWQWFGEVFESSYRTLAHISSRPMIIAETGSSEFGGSKARWVRRALGRELPRLGRIRALVWFDRPFNGLDVRVNSSAAALRALREASRAPRYRPDRANLIQALTRLPR